MYVHVHPIENRKWILDVQNNKLPEIGRRDLYTRPDTQLGYQMYGYHQFPYCLRL